MLSSQTVPVGTTPVDLLAGLDLDRPYGLKIHVGVAGVVFLGDSSVTPAAGYPAQAVEEFAVLHGEHLYAVVASSTATVQVLAWGE